MKKTGINFVNLNFLTLVLFLILIITLFLSGDIQYYVHPKMHIPLYIGAIIVLLMICGFFCDRSISETLKPRDLVFFIPTILALLYPPELLEERMSKNRGSEFSINTSPRESPSSSPTESSYTSPTESLSTSPVESSTYSDLMADRNVIINIKNPEAWKEDSTENKTDKSINNTQAGSEKDKVVTIDESNYTNSLTDIYLNIKAYVNRKISISGFAYHLDTLEKNQFVIARLVITCCAADAAIVGLVCTIKKKREISFDNWYQITGTIQQLSHRDEIVPQIVVSSIQPIEKPEVIFVY